MNNLEMIIPLLEFKENYIYELRILQRKKDNPQLVNNQNVRTIKTYNIYSKEYLKDKMEEIIHLCDFFNARAYIKLSPYNTEKIGLNMIQVICDKLKNKDYNFTHIVNKTLGNISPERKVWIIDIDEIEYLEKIKAIIPQESIIATIPTKSGVHLITSPFRVDEFMLHQELYYKCEIKKNNPTLLYCK